MKGLADLRSLAVLLFGAMLGASVARAQDAEPLTVEGPEPGLVRLGERSVVRLSVTNPEGEPERPKVPQVDGLTTEIGGPSQQSYQTRVGGRVWTERSIAFTIVIEPHREGEFTIPRFSWKTGKRTQTVGPLSLRVVTDVKGEELGFVDVTAVPQRVYVNEPIHLLVDFGVDKGLRLAQAMARNGQGYFKIELRAPWLDELEGAVPLEDEPEQSNVWLVLNRYLIRVGYGGDVTRDERTFHHFSLERSFLPTRTGKIEIPRPVLSFAVATGPDRRGFFGERIAGDEVEYFAYGKPLEIEVVPLPEVGRPTNFSGAVGRFSLDSAVDRQKVRVGDSIKLTLTVRGQGNLEFLGLPELPSVDGWHLLGRTENRDDESARVTYDLTPLRADAPSLPAVSWSYFDTRPGVERYQEVRTEPIAVSIEPLPDEERLAPLPGTEEQPLVPGVDDIHDIVTNAELASAPPAHVSHSPSLVLRIAAVILPWLIVLGGAWFVRSWRRRRADVVGRRARGARRSFETALDRGATADEALATYLAARLGVPEAAVFSPDLADRLLAAGVAEDLGAEVQRAVDLGTAARYGGGPGLEVTVAKALVSRLEAIDVRAVRGAVLGVLLALSLAAGLRAQGPVAEAERAYRDGDYAQAAVLYRSAAERPDADRRLWFNVGDAYYRIGRFAEALAAWERARLAMPRDRELRANISLARRALALGGAGEESFSRAVDDLRDSTTPVERMTLCVLLQLLAALLVIFGRGVVVRGLGVILTVPALLVALEVLWLGPLRSPRAVVIAPDARVVAEPREGLDALFQVKPGFELEVLAAGDPWTRVRVGGREGYVPSRAIELID